MRYLFLVLNSLFATAAASTQLGLAEVKLQLAGDERSASGAQRCSSMTKLGLPIAVLALSSCYGGHAEEEGTAEPDFVELRIPADAAECCTHLVVKMPNEFLVWDGSGLTSSFRPLDYRTGEPSDGLPANQPYEIHFLVNRAVFDWEGEFNQPWMQFPESDEKRFGLEYRPIKVPFRPEELWKRAYFKSGVSGEEFFISCIPPVGPNSISEPKACRMHLQLQPTEIEGRIWGAYIGVDFNATELAHWQDIESTALRHFEDRIEIAH